TGLPTKNGHAPSPRGVWLPRQPTILPPTSSFCTTPSDPSIDSMVAVISCTLSVGVQRLLGRLPSRICHHGDGAADATGTAAADQIAAASTATRVMRCRGIFEVSLVDSAVGRSWLSGRVIDDLLGCRAVCR